MKENSSAVGNNDIDSLVSLAQQGDKGALSRLLVIVSPLVHSKARCFLNSGVELDDLCQEGMLGVLSAVSTYSGNGGASFKTYAGVCINNRLVSVTRKRSGKSVFSGETVSLDKEGCDFSDSQSVEEQLINKIEFDGLLQYVNSRLSVKERDTLRLFLSGLSYEEISKRTGSSPKSVDNALQRVRQKLKKFNS